MARCDATCYVNTGFVVPAVNRIGEGMPPHEGARVIISTRACRSSCNNRSTHVANCSGEGFSDTVAAGKYKAGKKGGKSKGASASSSTLLQQEAMLQALDAKNKENSAKSAAMTKSGMLPEDIPDFTTVKSKSAQRLREIRKIDGTIYDNPMYYDWAFGLRQYEVEVDFLFDAYEEMTGEEPTSFVELGCGPAQHSLEMAESGLEIFAVDINEKMLSYAEGLAAEDDLKITFLRQDMRELELPGNKEVDLIACLFGTLQHMHTMEDALKCLRAAERALKPGGMLVIEVDHPSVLFDGSMASSADMWNLELSEAQVEVFWGSEGDEFDPISQVLQKDVVINVMMRGGDQLCLKQVVAMRQYTYQELLLLAHATGFKVKNVYSDFNMESCIFSGQRVAARDNDDDDDEDEGYSFRMILFLQKPEVL